jgi:hypothetical protein
MGRRRRRKAIRAQATLANDLNQRMRLGLA